MNHTLAVCEEGAVPSCLNDATVSGGKDFNSAEMPGIWHALAWEMDGMELGIVRDRLLACRGMSTGYEELYKNLAQVKVRCLLCPYMENR